MQTYKKDASHIKVAKAPSLNVLCDMLKKYYYNDNIKIDSDGIVSNEVKVIESIKVAKIKGGYLAYH